MNKKEGTTLQHAVKEILVQTDAIEMLLGGLLGAVSEDPKLAARFTAYFHHHYASTIALQQGVPGSTEQLVAKRAQVLRSMLPTNLQPAALRQDPPATGA